MHILANAILGTMIFVSSIPCTAKETPCPKKMAMEADKAVAEARDWRNLHGAYKRYRQCDDGVIAAGFTEAVLRILVDKWDTLKDFSVLARNDKAFAEFVYKHIDESASKADLLRVQENIKVTACRNAGKDVCNRIRSRIEDAIRRLNTPG